MQDSVEKLRKWKQKLDMIAKHTARKLDAAQREHYYSLHWYKELRTKKQLREIYRLARQAGANPALARRLRYLSAGHIVIKLEVLKNGKS